MKMTKEILYKEVDDRVVICKALNKIVTGQIVEIYFSISHNCWVAEDIKPSEETRSVHDYR